MSEESSSKLWQKVLSVFMSLLLAFTLWGAGASPAYADNGVAGESGQGLGYDAAVGAFGDYALLSTRTSSTVDKKPSIQLDQALVKADGTKTIVSQRHQGAGTGANSEVQIAGIIGDGVALSVTNANGSFGVCGLDGAIIVPIEYVAVDFDESSNLFYCTKASGEDIVLDVFDMSGTKKQSLNAGKGSPTSVEAFPGFVQVVANASNPDSQIGGNIAAAKVFSITGDELKTEPDIVVADAGDDSGTAFIKKDGTVWYKAAGGSSAQIASEANTGAMIDFLRADYAKIEYPKANGMAYVTSVGAESSEGVISAMADRILAPQESFGELGDANNKLIATLNGTEFLWEGKVIVAFNRLNEQGACQFWVYSAQDGKMLQGLISSLSQVSLEMQDGNYAISYTPASGSQQFAGFYYDGDLRLLSATSAPSPQGGTLPDGRTIQVTKSTAGGQTSYQVTDIYGAPIKCGDYTLALGPVNGSELVGAGDATSRVQHGKSDLYCAVDSNGKYGVVNSAGVVYVPFIYDNYFDLGYLSADSPLNQSNYVMVHRDGEWHFFDVSNAKPISSPAPIVEKKIAITNAKVVVKQKAYSGKRLYPSSVTVSIGGKRLVKGRDYKVSSRGGKLVGRYKVTITGIGDYSGSKTAYFKVVPKGTSIRHLVRGHRAFKITWKRNVKQTTGYQIRYSLNKHFKGAHYKYVKGSKRISTTVKHLKAHKRYYVQVRTYKKVHGLKYFSTWSKWRSVRTRG